MRTQESNGCKLNNCMHYGTCLPAEAEFCGHCDGRLSQT